MSKGKKRTVGERAEALGPRIDRLKTKLAAAKGTDGERAARVRLKRAQRKRRTLTTLAAGGASKLPKKE